MSINTPLPAPERVPNPLAAGSATLRRMVRGLDDHLSRRENVRLFTDDPSCILRYALTAAPRIVALSDGTVLKAGDLVADIHCWNDRVAAMPKGGPDLAWAQKTSTGLKHSLRLLAGALGTVPALAGVRACRAQVPFVGVGGSNASLSRIIRRMGFEDVDEGARARVHDALGNVLIGLLVWAHNPEALRRDKLVRERRPVWSSRATLLRVHGRDPRAQARDGA